MQTGIVTFIIVVLICAAFYDGKKDEKRKRRVKDITNYNKPYKFTKLEEHQKN